ncbi:MAG: DUF362 domain-containing protein [Planctomycetales bacterium]|nr:DUF362 domain-containing protein [Planctomycetales bacterium]
MSSRFTRRQVLGQGIATAGLAMTGHRLFRAQPASAAAIAAPSLPVAVQRCESYEPQVLGATLRESLDLIGGIKDLVAGKTVTIKLNLTGGPNYTLDGLPAHRTYHVHPSFVAATCSALSDAGAKRIILVESSYSRDPLEQVMSKGGWDINMINAAGNGKVAWADTRNRGTWSQYSRLTIPWGGYVYKAFDVNSHYEKTDVFVSLAKLKDHANAGVTLSIKNLFGIAPTSIYGDQLDGAGQPTVREDSTSARGDTLHKGARQPPAGAPPEIDVNSSRHWGQRVPRVTADLFGARPVDLCLIDGIETNRGGEGPWIKGVQALQPHLMLVGRNGVCTDAIGAAVMGYDPTAGHGEFPFMGDNHLALLADRGVGTHVVDQIEVRGLALNDAIYPFNPQRLKVGEPIFQ